MYCNPICAAQSAKCLVLKYVPYFQRLSFLSLLLMKGTFFTLWCNFCEQQNRRHTHCRQCTVVDREPYKTLLKPLSIIILQRFYVPYACHYNPLLIDLILILYLLATFQAHSTSTNEQETGFFATCEILWKIKTHSPADVILERDFSFLYGGWCIVLHSWIFLLFVSLFITW